MVSIIVSRSRNHVIGKGNRILWKLRDDLVHLKQLTSDQIIILGKNTYESMQWYYQRSGKNMPGRKYIVITSDKDYQVSNDQAVVSHSIDHALHVAKSLTASEIFVIGGSSVYEQILPITDKVYCTEVATDIDGDSYFPELSPDCWQEISREHHTSDDRNEFDFSFVVYERK